VVLGAAALFEGASFTVALRQFMRERGPGPFWKSLRASKDPGTYTVLAEDAAALLGLAVAAAGVWASHAMDEPRLDGAASLAIGVLLCGVAVVLIHESRGLLVGEGIRPATARDVRAIAQSQPGVKRVGTPLSMYIGPKEVLLTLDVEFDGAESAADIANAVAHIEQEIRRRYPVIRRIYIEASCLTASFETLKPAAGA
jgi:divalent metal cation (Fe/Co/Zn/Cd) transporter